MTWEEDNVKVDQIKQAVSLSSPKGSVNQLKPDSLKLLFGFSPRLRVASRTRCQLPPVITVPMTDRLRADTAHAARFPLSVAFSLPFLTAGCQAAACFESKRAYSDRPSVGRVH